MTINDPERYCAGLWDWAILDGCFGQTKIRPTDIDGEVERHGRFLVLETKQAGAGIPHGQMLTFEAKQRLGVFTIFIIWGDAGHPVQIQVMTRHKTHEVQPCNLSRLRLLTSQWYRWADAQV